MKEIGILLAEWSVTGLIVYAGFCGRRVLFIDGPRSATLTLGAIGFAMCMVMPAIHIFISRTPAHPLTILGYLFGALAVLAAATQLFRWGIPYLKDPAIALIVIAACIVIKSIIARMSPLVAG